MIAWIEGQISKGDMGASGGRLRITSVQQMAEQVAPDEPNDAQSVLENIDRLRERWARRHLDAKADTAVSYASRTKTTILAYLEWAAAPDKYNPRKVLLKRGEPAATKTKKAKPAAVTAPVPPEPPQQPPMAAKSETRNFPLGGGRGAILFELPPEGVTFNDVMKYAVHLATLATDFDIGNAEQRQVFGLMVRGGRE